jgi:hypothetical protein
MRRTLLVVLIAAAMLVASALPALAQGPPTGVPTLPGPAKKNVLKAAETNPVIDVDLSAGCVFLNAPPGSTIDDRGHQSAFPDRCE